jgi:CubicO group peptidase (beta-lactamase class C family)
MWTVEGLHGAALVTVDGSTAVEITDGQATAETRFPIAAVGKQFAAVAALQLAERGLLELDQPVGRWFPDSPPWWQEVTLHHLLTHTSGIGDWPDVPGFDEPGPMTHSRRLALLPRAEPHSRPGVRWLLSGPGYLLVAHIVEQAAGQEYGAFVTESLLAPLGMTSTTVGRPDGAGAARGHHAGAPLSGEVPPQPGTGDLWSTVGDLARWSRALHTGELLGWESHLVLTGPLALIGTQPQPGQAFVADHYGYGLFVGAIGGHRAYFHPGETPGFTAFSAWLPDRRAGLIILADDDTADVHALVRQLLSAAGLS